MRVKAALVTGWGAVALTGPSSDSVKRAWWKAPMRSSNPIQLIHWRPLPMTPPTPITKGSSIWARAPPLGESTMPVRMWTTRMPASRAGSAVASQAWQTSGKKPAPGSLCSVSTSAPRSP
ncbi:hypothetical protein D3C87_1790890 [compost metagenome]